MLIFGINPVIEALRAGRVLRLRVSARNDRRIDEVLALASKRKIPAERVDALALDRATKGGVHQGVVADIEDVREYSVAELVDLHSPIQQSRTPLIVVLDGIEDPHNAGAIL